MVGLFQYGRRIVDDRLRSNGDTGEPWPKQVGHLRGDQSVALHSSAPYFLVRENNGAHIGLCRKFLGLATVVLQR